MGERMRVRPLGGDRFAITVRGHELTVDQPVADGGEDTAPTPTELFVAGLAACVAFYARRYLARHDLSAEGLLVESDFSIGGRPARVDRWSVWVTPPPSLPEERREAFLAVISHCTVHNTLQQAPEVEIRLAATGSAAG